MAERMLEGSEKRDVSFDDSYGDGAVDGGGEAKEEGAWERGGEACRGAGDGLRSGGREDWGGRRRSSTRFEPSDPALSIFGKGTASFGGGEGGRGAGSGARAYMPASIVYRAYSKNSGDNSSPGGLVGR